MDKLRRESQKCCDQSRKEQGRRGEKRRIEGTRREGNNECSRETKWTNTKEKGAEQR